MSGKRSQGSTKSWCPAHEARALRRAGVRQTRPRLYEELVSGKRGQGSTKRWCPANEAKALRRRSRGCPCRKRSKDSMKDDWKWCDTKQAHLDSAALKLPSWCSLSPRASTKCEKYRYANAVLLLVNNVAEQHFPQQQPQQRRSSAPTVLDSVRSE